MSIFLFCFIFLNKVSIVIILLSTKDILVKKPQIRVCGGESLFSAKLLSWLVVKPGTVPEVGDFTRKVE